LESEEPQVRRHPIGRLVDHDGRLWADQAATGRHLVEAVGLVGAVHELTEEQRIVGPDQQERSQQAAVHDEPAAFDRSLERVDIRGRRPVGRVFDVGRPDTHRVEGVVHLGHAERENLPLWCDDNAAA